MFGKSSACVWLSTFAFSLYYFEESTCFSNVNYEDPDQPPHSAMTNLGLHTWSVNLLKDARHKCTLSTRFFGEFCHGLAWMNFFVDKIHSINFTNGADPDEAVHDELPNLAADPDEAVHNELPNLAAHHERPHLDLRYCLIWQPTMNGLIWICAIALSGSPS